MIRPEPWRAAGPTADAWTRYAGEVGKGEES